MRKQSVTKVFSLCGSLREGTVLPSVLIIDDEISILDNIQFNLELYGYTVWKARNGSEGLELFKSHAAAIDAVVTDMKMPGLSGLDVLKGILDINPDIGVIVLTGHGDMDNAINAMREGAFNYILKPFQVENLVLSLENAIEKKNILVENKRLHEDLIKTNRYLQGLHDSAQHILMNFVPVSLPEFSTCDTAYIYRSCEKVGGDMIDVFETEHFLFFYIFDVCSHGILAAVNTIIIKTYFYRLKSYRSDTDIINNLKTDFGDLNMELCKNTPSGIFATVFAGCIDKRTNMMYYASAGHIDQYLIKNETLISLPSTGTILGSFENADFEVVRHPLYSNDRLLLFTDGLTDAWENETCPGHRCIREIIENKKTGTIGTIVNYLYQETLRHSGGSFDDDLTILGLQIKEDKP